MRRHNQGYVLALVLVVTLLLCSVASILATTVAQNIQSNGSGFVAMSRTVREEQKRIEEQSRLERYQIYLHCGMRFSDDLSHPDTTDQRLRYLLLNPTAAEFPSPLPQTELNTTYSDDNLKVSMTLLSATLDTEARCFVYQLLVQASDSVSTTLLVRFAYVPDVEAPTNYLISLESADESVTGPEET